MKIYLVIQNQRTAPREEWYRVGETVFYTTRTLAKAFELIKKSRVAKWCWWEIKSHDLDSDEWPEQIGYFGPRGGKLTRKAIIKKCVTPGAL
jgi:hypothetical protein